MSEESVERVKSARHWTPC